MKLTGFLTVTAWCSIIVVRSETMDVDQETLLKRAAEQLDRLTPYRKTGGSEESAEINLTDLLESWKPVADQNHLDGTKNDADQGVPWEVLEMLPEQSESGETEETESDATKRADDNEGMLTIGVITDPQYAAMMQERIKRGYNSGSASLLTSIAGGVLSGVASASSSSAGKASASSSEYKPTYSAPGHYSVTDYGQQPFGPWDFKKAIFGTLFQALKAIGGGVLALKGQLVKGSGYLLAAKSKVFGKTGDAITYYGKQLAASALTDTKPPPAYYPPPIQHIDNDQGGLLIVTPTKSDLDEHNDQHTDVQAKPDLASLEESFGGPTKGSVITNFLSSIPKGIASTSGTKDQPVVTQDNNNVAPYSTIQHPAPALGTLDHHYTTNHDNPVQNYEQPYHAGQDAYQLPQLPQTALPHHHHFPNLDDVNLGIQPGAGYPPLHLQYPDLQGALLNSPKLPHDDGASVYSSLSIDTEPQIASLKVHSNALDLPKLQGHVDFHGQPHFANHVHDSLGGPLRISLLNSKPASYYWQTHGSLPTPGFDTFHQFHKRNAHNRRMFAKRLARYSSLQRRHRV
ncbi:hypothetical protein DMN91_003446 [Ooceraea biroi]|uniref:Uncharacterized protein n=1 Tax=Ooceraea biroi TaxID=2015173 RepID=A0A3L8DSU5_OOCBI|nr:hypothetical protein DMN91_003446 [Ooceraea biroi]